MKTKTVHCLFWPWLCIVFGVLGWLTFVILDLDEEKDREIKHAVIEEQTRLALWRMDAAMSHILVSENKRPPLDFFTSNGKNIPEYVILYFQIDADGKLTTPNMARATATHRRHSSSQLGQAIRDGYLYRLENEIMPALPNLANYKPSTAAGGKKPIAKIPPPLKPLPEFEILNTDEQQTEVAKQVDAIHNESEQRDLQVASIDFMARSRSVVNSSSNAIQENLSKASIAEETVAEREPFPKIRDTPLRNVDDNRDNLAQSLNGLTVNDIDVPSLLGGYAELPAPSLTIPLGITGEKPPLHPASPMALSAPPVTAKEPFDTTTLTQSLQLDNTSGGHLTATSQKAGGYRSIESVRSGSEGNWPEGSIDAIHSRFIPDFPVSISSFTPHWANGELVFVRTITAADRSLVQGVWVDSKMVTDILLQSARDILPEARLIPFSGDSIQPEHISRLLAGVPMLVIPGNVPMASSQSGVNTLEISLILAWAFAFVAAAGVSLLIIGIIRLNDRRATFVSAVTHELRTPLTTFNLYTEMLMHGMVPADRHTGYYSTLRQEALRLTHLVDNVLGFSRIEKSDAKKNTSLIESQALYDNILGQIGPVLERSDMQLSSRLRPLAKHALLKTDTGSIEQIMINLADNAAKYAGDYSKKVELEINAEGRELYISFRDYGPGIAEEMKKRLFKPFSRSAEDAAGNKPGIGLGLALSRELARKVGGGLRIDRTCRQGTRFILSLPLVKPVKFYNPDRPGGQQETSESATHEET